MVLYFWIILQYFYLLSFPLDSALSYTGNANVWLSPLSISKCWLKPVLISLGTQALHQHLVPEELLACYTVLAIFPALVLYLGGTPS
jgi:hypothetical protein